MAKKYNNRYCFGYRSDICGYPFRVSKRFKLEKVVDEEDFSRYFATGSANDVMKVIRDLESDGYETYYIDFRDNYVFRTRKTYRVAFEDRYGQKSYSVYLETDNPDKPLLIF